jgi:pyruvate/2-oxoglutarate/acetoin dehydrogenase E1 component
VVDPFTIKPLDAATILSAARATGGRIITVEDHYKEGTLNLFLFFRLTAGLYHQIISTIVVC